ncbi:hypothetical protein ACI798_01400 [Geodermatophilus sp. SYSU D01045]
MTRRLTVRDRWYRTVIRCHEVSGSCRELLAHMAVCHMTDLGHVKVPRAELAAALDIAEQRVTVRIGEAVKAGLLARTGGGKNGQTMQYAASFPSGQGAASRHPRPEVEVSGKRHPQNDTLDPGSGCRDAAPIRARALLPEPATPDPHRSSAAPSGDHDVTAQTSTYGSDDPLPVIAYLSSRGRKSA